MTTIHSPNEVEISDILPANQRHGIPTDVVTNRVNKLFNLPSVFAHSQPVIELGLPFPMPIRQYNRHMGGSDSNAQTRAYYSPETHFFRYWWPLFKLLLDASVLNAYILWKLRYPESKLSHSAFQNQVAMSLVQDPAGSGRKRATKVGVIGLQGLEKPEHDWVSLSKKKYCQICSIDKERASQKPLSDLTNLGAKRRRRGAQTRWGCSGCVDSACCKKPACWDALHA